MEFIRFLNKLGKIAGKAAFFFIFTLIYNSCATTSYTEKFYADVIGFNDVILQSYITKNAKETDILQPIPGSNSNNGSPYNILNTSDVNYLKDAIDRITDGQNTAALYALDIGLDRVSFVNKKLMENDPDSRYYVLVFTDCLDNISVDMAIRTNRGNYSRGVAGRIAYGNAMQDRMNSIINNYSFFNLFKNPSSTNIFQSYVFLLDDDDLVSYPDEFVESLYSPYLASQNDNAPRPDVIQGETASQLFEEFEKVFSGAYTANFSFNIPKDFVGQRIHIQLSPTEYLEADLRLEMKSRFIFLKKPVYSLENITTSEGLTFNEILRIEMDNESFNDRLNTVPFTVNNLMLNNKSYLVDVNEVTQQVFMEDTNRFVNNSEYTVSANIVMNTYVLFIIDSSLSMEGLETAKETAKLIIDYITVHP